MGIDWNHGILGYECEEDVGGFGSYAGECHKLGFRLLVRLVQNRSESSAIPFLDEPRCLYDPGRFRSV
jgi:hypothetical protein